MLFGYPFGRSVRRRNFSDFFPVKSLPALLLVRRTDNYRMLPENSRGNLAVFSFSGQDEAAKMVRLGFESVPPACNPHGCLV
ncbi:MAG: hypothetical protein D3925_13285 [Candidatus Electrothrix sp. AR5]|nr:hypothetical protein [Candidatus Electrothrix sp. AR5]